MLTVKENMRQVIPGGNPDRLVNQYEPIQLLFHPFMLTSPLLKKGDENVVNAWGITNSFPDNGPGPTVKKRAGLHPALCQHQVLYPLHYPRRPSALPCL